MSTIIRNAIRSSFYLRHTTNPTISVSVPFLRDSSRRFTTETEQPHSLSSPSPAGDATVDSILQIQNPGASYGRLLGGAKHTLKTDIINMFEGCNLTQDDIKVSYDPTLSPAGMIVQFPSRSAFDTAARAIARKGRQYKLERANRSHWDRISPYNGKTLMLQGIPWSALVEDVERFLSGCDYDQSSIQLTTKPANRDRIRIAYVRFPSQIQAWNAFITKNRGFCLNSQITVQVLQ